MGDDKIPPSSVPIRNVTPLDLKYMSAICQTDATRRLSEPNVALTPACQFEQDCIDGDAKSTQFETTMGRACNTLFNATAADIADCLQQAIRVRREYVGKCANERFENYTTAEAVKRLNETVKIAAARVTESQSPYVEALVSPGCGVGQLMQQVAVCKNERKLVQAAYATAVNDLLHDTPELGKKSPGELDKLIDTVALQAVQQTATAIYTTKALCYDDITTIWTDFFTGRIEAENKAAATYDTKVAELNGLLSAAQQSNDTLLGQLLGKQLQRLEAQRPQMRGADAAAMENSAREQAVQRQVEKFMKAHQPAETAKSVKPGTKDGNKNPHKTK